MLANQKCDGKRHSEQSKRRIKVGCTGRPIKRMFEGKNTHKSLEV